MTDQHTTASDHMAEISRRSPEVKHTPGPWRVGRPSVMDGVQVFKDWDAPMRSDVICTMPSSGKITANARLIAAAPAMLEALEDLIEDYPGAADRPLVRAAIAQARGVSTVAASS